MPSSSRRSSMSSCKIECRLRSTSPIMSRAPVSSQIEVQLDQRPVCYGPPSRGRVQLSRQAVPGATGPGCPPRRRSPGPSRETRPTAACRANLACGDMIFVDDPGVADQCLLAEASPLLTATRAIDRDDPPGLLPRAAQTGESTESTPRCPPASVGRSVHVLTRGRLRESGRGLKS